MLGLDYEWPERIFCAWSDEHGGFAWIMYRGDSQEAPPEVYMAAFSSRVGMENSAKHIPGRWSVVEITPGELERHFKTVDYYCRTDGSSRLPVTGIALMDAPNGPNVRYMK